MIKIRNYRSSSPCTHASGLPGESSADDAADDLPGVTSPFPGLASASLPQPGHQESRIPTEVGFASGLTQLSLCESPGVRIALLRHLAA